MKVEIPKGKYILAVSGGVDSMVLLDLLSKKPDVELIVGHFNHGIRADSKKDERLVKQSANKYKLTFEGGHGKLGEQASEETARKARYKFLDEVKTKNQAKAIITAHHQDDLIETAFINLVRGTKRKGLSSLADNSKVLRPLIKYKKAELLAYATKNKLNWRDDSTNLDLNYLRNYIRLKILPKLSPRQRKALIENINNASKLNKLIDGEMKKISEVIKQKELINRQKFSKLPADMANELVNFWLRQEKIKHPDSVVINRLANAIRTGLPGSRQPVKGTKSLEITKQSARFV